MKIRTKLDNYRDLFHNLTGRIRFEPFGEKFEKSYKKFLEFLVDNIADNKDDLVLLLSESVKYYIKDMAEPLANATEKELAYYNAGRVQALCEIIQSLGDYNELLQKFTQPYLDLEVGDTVYIKIGDIIYKTTIIKKDGDKLQVQYGRRWFSKADYLDYIFPVEEKEYLHQKEELRYHSKCDKCLGFRQGKCAYGYSLSTYKDFTYRFDNTRYKVTKGRPNEMCSKTTKY